MALSLLNLKNKLLFFLTSLIAVDLTVIYEKSLNFVHVLAYLQGPASIFCFTFGYEQ